ncbi:O-antigen ligase family protein [Olivibacter sitiensis]|uniref:O-antigen ligase family protein n=1 Tax=Olivibacter sitiensis TaxID=376470 RepID=UPI000A025A38|nr:O-antigen ligase family protein [Olivibacter sitiensis]
MFSTFSDGDKPNLRTLLFVAFVLLSVSLISVLTITSLTSAFAFALAAPIAVIILIFVFRDPRLGFCLYLIYCFMLPGIMRNLGISSLGPGMEIILGVTWLSILVQRKEYHWENLSNDYMALILVWFIISVFQVVNPTDASIKGWLAEFRFTALNWIMIAPLAFVLFNRKKDLNRFFLAIFSLSLLASLYAIKQYLFGVSEMEQLWLNNGANFTHVIFGRLRMFSFFTDAGQFGASQAHMALMAIILSFGPFSRKIRFILVLLSAIFLIGMLISGTRGAFFTLMSGGMVWLLLTKNFKTLFIGTIMVVGFVVFLKYTSIGSSSYQIERLRTALDFNDLSFQARLENQKKLAELMEDLPFGGGLGVSGANGTLYNSSNPLASIPPDSYWVKIWVMYGVVGLVIWFSIICYIIGKCCGISWNLRDEKLRVKIIALTAGTVGLFVSSYGNEVMNSVPSCIVLYLSWSYVVLSPAMDGKKEDEYVSLKQKDK